MNQNTSSIKLFDNHVHLNSNPLDKDIDEIVKQSIERNVSKMICIGFDVQSSLKAVEIAKKYPNIVYAAVGIHPTECFDTLTDKDLQVIEELLDEECVVSLGEIGLDYHWDTVSKEQQKLMFVKQLEIAKRKNKPVIIHSRDSTNDTYEILKQNDISKIGGVMHCYAGSLEMAYKFIDLNMSLSIAGVVTFKNAKVTHRVVENIDLKHLLIETDCPYLTPEPNRGKTNYPYYVCEVASKIAQLKNMTYQEVVDQTYNNTLKRYNIKE